MQTGRRRNQANGVYRANVRRGCHCPDLGILRLRRCKTGIVNGAFLAALQGILEQLLCRQDYEFPYYHGEAAEDLARGWFENKKAKSKVATLLRKFGLDEGAIEAEAFRLRRRTSSGSIGCWQGRSLSVEVQQDS